jgi:MoaE-MoaD fusion protein
MQVRVLFFGILKDLVGKSEEFVEVTPNLTLAELFQTYSERFQTLRDKDRSILFARNREFARPDTVLSEGDEVAFLPPVSGGLGGQYNFFKAPRVRFRHGRGSVEHGVE